MKPKVDVISMFLVSVNGRVPVLVVKKRKAKEVFTGVVPIENVSLIVLKEFSHKCLSSFSCVFT